MLNFTLFKFQNNVITLQTNKMYESMKKNFYLISMLVFALGLASCGKKEGSQDDAPMVVLETVKGLNELGATTFTGKTKSAEEVNLAFRVAGQIQRVLVKEGDYVRQGQVVAMMDSRDYQVQLAATQAEYQQVKADAERVMALYQEGNTTASNYDKARYGLQQITQKLANHRNQLADTQLRSNISGYVQTKFHESGETVSAGMPVVSVFGRDGIEVQIQISATDYANIDKFTSFKCQFDVTGDKEFPLSLVRMSQEANTSQLYNVRLKFMDAVDHKKITPGMTTIVYAEVSNKDAAGKVHVPSSAVIDTNGKTQVFVYDEKAGVVKLRNVNVARVERDGAMEVDNGLKSGERVVAAGAHHVKDGQKVRVLQKPSASNVGGLL